jgi:adenylate kinase
MNMILLGLPGAGKGTQAKMISQDFNIPHIATGDIFRQAIKNKTSLGEKASEYLDAGELVPDEVTIGIVKERLNEDDCKSGFILDGFPRTLKQAEALNEILNEMGEKINLALYIRVTEDELIRRLSGRRICNKCGATYHLDYNPPIHEGICDNCGGKLIQRSDDREETVKNRIEVNNKQMEELLNYYKNMSILKTLESKGNIDIVYSNVIMIIEEE